MSGMIHDKLTSIQNIEQRLAIKKNILLNEAFHSTHPSDIIKANSMIQSIENKPDIDRKSYIIDPYQFNSFLGYKDKPYSLTYGMLRKISYAVPIVRSIISTRIDQVASFCEPQRDKYSIGFVIRKKRQYFNNKDEAEKLSIEDCRKIEKMTQFILDCGMSDQSFEGDDFDTFVRKVMNDALTFDQMTFEIVRNRRQKPYSFLAVDASTIRISESVDDINYDKDKNRIYDLSKKKINGYYPSHCQIRDSAPVADFYPWELCFGVRNPTTNIYANGYGVSELEILTNTITSMLWSDEYNRRFFSQGSAPKGLLKIKSGTNINGNTLTQFRQQWQAMMAGVYNSWKTPILEGDVDWIDLQKTNNDMEFSNWQEYLIKISCAVFRIDPAEINFPLSGGAEQKTMFEGNNEARLKHSKDKGLFPLLKFFQSRINKFVASQLDPSFEFVFLGMDTDDPKVELENDIKMMTNFMTIDEIRVRRGLMPLGEEKGGNIIANSIWMQSKNAEMMAEQQKQQMQQGGGQEQGQATGQAGQEGEGEQEPEYEDEGNPFEKAFSQYLETLN